MKKAQNMCAMPRVQNLRTVFKKTKSNFALKPARVLDRIGSDETSIFRIVTGAIPSGAVASSPTMSNRDMVGELF